MAKLPKALRSSTKRLPAQRPRVVHYPDPTRSQALYPYLSPVQQAAYLARREREYRLAYAEWRVRQSEYAASDRKVRRFWLGFGAVVATAVLSGVGLLVWAVFHAFTAIGLGLFALPFVVLALTGVVVGGHRCVTVIQHWH